MGLDVDRWLGWRARVGGTSTLGVTAVPKHLYVPPIPLALRDLFLSIEAGVLNLLQYA